MADETLKVEILTPHGDRFEEENIETIVFRRKETRFEVGSEVAIFPQHGPILIRLPIAPIRYQAHERVFYIVVGGGYAEIKGNAVLVVTPRFERIDPKSPDASDVALKVSKNWRTEKVEFHKQMIGYEQASRERRP